MVFHQLQSTTRVKIANFHLKATQTRLSLTKLACQLHLKRNCPIPARQKKVCQTSGRVRLLPKFFELAPNRCYLRNGVGWLQHAEGKVAVRNNISCGLTGVGISVFRLNEYKGCWIELPPKFITERRGCNQENRMSGTSRWCLVQPYIFNDISNIRINTNSNYASRSL